MRLLQASRRLYQTWTANILPRSARRARILEQLQKIQGLPKPLQVDNDPEFLGALCVGWCKMQGSALMTSRPEGRIPPWSGANAV